MTLLVDNQLPLALARYLAANGWKAALLQAFSKVLPELRDMLAAGDAVVEIR